MCLNSWAFLSDTLVQKLHLDILNEFLQFLNGYLRLKSPRAFCPRRIFQAFWRFSGWILAKLALIQSKRHLQHDNMPFFPLALCFMTFWLGHVQKSKILEKSDLRLKAFDVLLGLLAVKKLLRKCHQDRQFLPWSSHVQWQ